MARWILRDGRARAAFHARGDLLEIGIGAGASLSSYAADVRITGIDLSPGMLAHAQRRLNAQGRSGDLRIMDAQDLKFPDQSFDSVAFNLVLCTIPDPLRSLREALRVAKPGATMTFLEHVRSDHRLVAFPQDLVNAALGRAMHDRVNQDTERLVRIAGVQVLGVDRWLLGAMTLIIGRAPQSD